MKHTTKSAIFKSSFLSLALSVPALADVSDEDIRQSYHEKAALTQLLRWYQYYENNDVGITNQLDILSDDFSVTSPSGTASGHKEYQAAVSRFPANWKNSHDVKSTNVSVDDDGTLSLTAEIVYSNLGMTDNLVSQRIGYEATLVYADEATLPKFKDMVITPLGSAQATEFKDTYVENRLSALISYWLYLVEHPGRHAEPFREILAPEVDIKFTGEGDSYRSHDELAAWIAGPVSSLPATRHAVGALQYSELEEGRYELIVPFDWQGITPDNKRMSAKTKHTWIVTDDPSERFARVEKIRVVVIEPFSVVE